MEANKPVLLTVDDDPGVSRAVARDLRRRYGQDYRIVRAESGPQALEALRRGGRLVSIARPPPEPQDDREVHYIFVRPSGYDLGEHITPLVQAGGLRVHVQERFPLERAADAHERIEDGHVRGKLVLTLP